MKKLIYKMFTQENGIKMNMDVLEHVSTRLEDVSSINDFLLAYKTKYNGNTLLLSQVDELLGLKNCQKNFFEIKEFKFKRRNLINELGMLKKNLMVNPTHISLLVPGQESVIFGMFYWDRSGIPIIEDEHEIVELDLSNYQNSFFLHENIFMGIEGVLVGKIFKVGKVLLPEVTKGHSVNRMLENRSAKICIVNGCDGLENEIYRIYQKHKPSLFISSVANEKLIPNFPLHTVLCKSTDETGILPTKLSGVETTDFLIPSSNPVQVSFHKKSVVFVDMDIESIKGDGVFCGDNSFETFVETFSSQSSLNPFKSTDLGILNMPDVLVIATNSKPCVHKTEFSTIVCLPEFKHNSYCLVDLDEDTVEVHFL